MPPDKYGPLTIESFEPMISLVLRNTVYDRQKWDDCRQEARIRVWEILRDRPDATRSYVNTAIRNQIRLIARSNRMTGDTGSRQGKPIDPLRRPFQSLDAAPDDVGGTAAGSPWAAESSCLDPQSDQRLEALCVRDAIRRLSSAQKDHVVKVFLLDYTHAQSGHQHENWKNARERLREDLKDLAA